MIFQAITMPASANDYFSQFEKNTIPTLTLPNIQFHTLDNGLSLILLEDHSLPYISMEVSLKAGSIFDPKEKLGLANITASSMRSAGTKSLSPSQFDIAVDELGARISSYATKESAIATIHSLSSKFTRAGDLFWEMIFSPRFEDKRVKLAILQLRESIRRIKDQPKQYIGIHYAQAIYGKNSPWARIPSDKKLKSIGIDNVKKNHAHYYKPSNMTVVIAGNFNTLKMRAQLKKWTSHAVLGPVSFPKVKKISYKLRRKNKYIKRDIPQCHVRIGHLGVKRHNPDWYAIKMLNYVWGQRGMHSILMNDIRTTLGYVYGISGGIGQGTDYGLFTVGYSTSTATAKKAKKRVIEHIKKISNGIDITASELEIAKQSMLGSLISEITDPFTIVSTIADFKQKGYPWNYWIEFKKSIESVTVDDIKRVGHTYIHPDKLSIVELGQCQQ